MEVAHDLIFEGKLKTNELGKIKFLFKLTFSGLRIFFFNILFLNFVFFILELFVFLLSPYTVVIVLWTQLVELDLICNPM